VPSSGVVSPLLQEFARQGRAGNAFQEIAWSENLGSDCQSGGKRVHFSLDGEQILQLHNEKARRRHRSGTGYFFLAIALSRGRKG